MFRGVRNSSAIVLGESRFEVMGEADVMVHSVLGSKDVYVVEHCHGWVLWLARA